MEIPEAWFYMGSVMHHAFGPEYPDFSSGIADIVERMCLDQRQSLLDFLRNVVTSSHTTEELSEIIEKFSPEIYIVIDEGNDLTGFFAAILEVVEEVVEKG